MKYDDWIVKRKHALRPGDWVAVLYRDRSKVSPSKPEEGEVLSIHTAYVEFRDERGARWFSFRDDDVFAVKPKGNSPVVSEQSV